MFRIQTCAVVILCAAVSFLGAATAHATTIDFITSEPCAGLTICGPISSLVTLTAVGGTFEYKTRMGATGLGVSNATAGEIDTTESINGALIAPQVITGFRVLFLYNGGEFGDLNEIAKLTINGTTFGTLSAVAENTAVWSLSGATVTNCGATNESGTGCFDVLNPFGSALVSNFSFTAVHVPNAANDSDFSLGSLSVLGPNTPIPEPASLTLVGIGLAAGFKRLRRTA